MDDGGVVIEEHAEGGADGGALAEAVGEADAGLPVIVGIAVELGVGGDFDVGGEFAAGDAGGFFQLFAGAGLFLDDVGAALEVVAAGEDVVVTFLAEGGDEGFVVAETKIDSQPR